MSIKGSARNLSAELLRAVGTRIELFGLEWQQACEDVPRLLVFWILGLLGVVFAFGLLTLFLIVTAWDTPYRGWVILGLCAIYAIVGLGLLWRALTLTRAGGLNPFSGTLEELRRDADALAQSDLPSEPLSHGRGDRHD